MERVIEKVANCNLENPHMVVDGNKAFCSFVPGRENSISPPLVIRIGGELKVLCRETDCCYCDTTIKASQHSH